VSCPRLNVWYNCKERRPLVDAVFVCRSSQISSHDKSIRTTQSRRRNHQVCATEVHIVNRICNFGLVFVRVGRQVVVLFCFLSFRKLCWNIDRPRTDGNKHIAIILHLLVSDWKFVLVHFWVRILSKGAIGYFLIGGCISNTRLRFRFSDHGLYCAVHASDAAREA
jgi:hypothetical protein